MSEPDPLVAILRAVPLRWDILEGIDYPEYGYVPDYEAMAAAVRTWMRQLLADAERGGLNLIPSGATGPDLPVVTRQHFVPKLIVHLGP